jgi:hypothetical protein
MAVDWISENVEGLSEDDMDTRVEGKQLLDEFQYALGPREFVVVDDVSAFAGFLEVVVDKGFGFEDKFVVDGTGDDENVRSSLICDEIMLVGAKAHAEQSEFKVRLDCAGTASGCAGEEEIIVTQFEGTARIVLEDFFVELGFLLSINLVRSEVVQEVTDDSIGEQVESGAVQMRRASHAV